MLLDEMYDGPFQRGCGQTPTGEVVPSIYFHPPAHGSEVSPAARNTLDSARIPRASKLLICGLFLKGRVLAQDGVADGEVWSYPVSLESVKTGH